jgi:hypothetical protein
MSPAKARQWMSISIQDDFKTGSMHISALSAHISAFRIQLAEDIMVTL